MSDPIFLLEEEIFQKFPGTESDIASVHEWMDNTPLFTPKKNAKLVFRLVIEPVSQFEKDTLEMLGTYDEFPDDAERTNEIVWLLENGHPQLPIFVDEQDGFIMEGRHRIVAFYLQNLPTVPTIYIKKIE